MKKSLLLSSVALCFVLIYGCTGSRGVVAPDLKATFDLVSLENDVAKGEFGSSFHAHVSYRDRYADLAVAEMVRSGVPASITIAQGILESNAGQSELARKANNHFGIKCGKYWTGKGFLLQDDDRDELGNPVKSCFRVYDNTESSFLDHSEFLRDPRKYNRYGFLFNLAITDYRGWASGLQSAGYATASDYASRLIGLIERYELHKYDLMGLSRSSSEAVVARRVGLVNDTKVVLAREGERLSDIAMQMGIAPERLVEYNDGLIGFNEPLTAQSRVFIQPKRASWRGTTTHHVVRDNETIFTISQLYGVQLGQLLERNGLIPGQEPLKGEKVRIQGTRGRGEFVRTRYVGSQVAGSIPDYIRVSVADEVPVVGDDELVPVSMNDPGASFSTRNMYHTVQRGDTLFGLSRRYNTTVLFLKSMNNLTGDSIRVGQRLRVN